MKPAFIIVIADVAFMLFLYNATPEASRTPIEIRVDHLASDHGLVEPLRVERAYVRLVVSTSGVVRPEVSFGKHVVALGARAEVTTLEEAARSLTQVDRALSSLGAPPDIPIVFQFVMPGNMRLIEGIRLHAKAKQLGLDCEIVAYTEGEDQ